MDIHETILDFIAGGRAFAVALVLRAEGSTPCKAGAKALIDEAGRITGTIGGGRVEATAQAGAVEAIQSGRPIVFDFELGGEAVTEDDPVCGGAMRVLVDPTAAKDQAAYAQSAEARQRRERGGLLTTVRSGNPLQVVVKWCPEETLPPGFGFPGVEAIHACLAREMPQLFTEDPQRADARVEVLVEPIVPPPRLLIVGGGHIGQAVAQRANLLGFDITVIDDRPEFSDPALFPKGVATRCGGIANEVAAFPLDRSTFVVIVTRGHRHDAAALAACIGRPAAYIGMIGSRRKVALLRQEFLECRGALPEEWSRIYAPIGLDIGAVTVPEIATSIVAQLIAVRRKRGADLGR